MGLRPPDKIMIGQRGLDITTARYRYCVIFSLDGRIPLVIICQILQKPVPLVERALLTMGQALAARRKRGGSGSSDNVPLSLVRRFAAYSYRHEVENEL